MRARYGWTRWRLAAGVTAVGLCAFSLTLQGAPGDRGVVAKRSGSTTAPPDESMLRIGPGVDQTGFPVLEPVIVDYRDDATSRAMAAGEPAPILGNTSPWERGPRPTGGVAAPGDPCRFDADCDDCNPCTLDECSATQCTGGPFDGRACNNAQDCGGTCTGGANAGNPCTSDLECCDPANLGDDGTCTFFSCDPVNGSFPDDTFCVNFLPATDQFISGSECDDGLECNGQETCDTGVCQPGTPLCDPGSQWCNEEDNACEAFCTDDSQCEDGNNCTNDICDAKTCVGGNDGAPCASDADCGGGTCTGGGTGACIRGTPPCGPDGGCTEGDPVICDLGRCCVGSTCSADTFPDCEAAGGVWLSTFGGQDDSDQIICGPVPDTGQTVAACGVDQFCPRDICPAYSSGVAPPGDFGVVVGPVSRNDCDLVRLGDDYTADVADNFIQVEFVRLVSGVPRNARYAVEFWDENGVFIEDFFFPDGTNAAAGGVAVRQIGLDPPLIVPATGFLTISVATEFGLDGALTWVSTDAPADVGTNDASRMFAQTNNGRHTGETVDFLGVCNGGGRDGLWCDRAVTSADTDWLKVGCPGGTGCDPIDNVLAFELVGEGSGTPAGACCDTASGSCSSELPWVCTSQGDVFQGTGTQCASCSLSPSLDCATDADCAVCLSSDLDVLLDNGEPRTCSSANDCLDLDPNALCGAVGDGDGADNTCSVPREACTVNACCDSVFGLCAEADSGHCSVTTGQSCLNDSQCPEGETCIANCPVGICQTGLDAGEACLVSADCDEFSEGDQQGTCGLGLCQGGITPNQPCDVDADCDLNTPGDGIGDCVAPSFTAQGFGTSCGPDCCDQPTPTGGTTCLAVNVHEFIVPNPGEPPISVTITGNNADAAINPFDDWTTLVCEGHSPTTACDPNVQCPNGICEQICTAGLTGDPCTVDADCDTSEGAGDGTCEFRCNGGDNDTLACNRDASCPSGTCTQQLTPWPPFNPDGATLDPGWSEGFSIDKCANVRIDFCCSSNANGDVVRPAWGNLLRGCPLEQVFGNSGLEPPIGLGRGTQGFQRGGPFCAEDNLWGTFGPLPPGTYFYPIYSAPQGTYASPPGDTYQMHFTVGACPVAACCASVCFGGAEDGELCDPADPASACVTGGGICGAGLCEGGANDGLLCDPDNAGTTCPSGDCIPTSGCGLLNEIECNDVGGFWLAFENLPSDVDNVVTCDVSHQCLGNVCEGGPDDGQACTTDADCASSSVCDIGACCRGPGDCVDDDGTGSIDQETCELLLNPPGTYVGGAKCDFAQPQGPCPICTAQRDDQCQSGVSNWFFSMARNAPGTAADGGGVTVAIADDFVAVGDRVNEFCFEYLTGVVSGGFITDCEGALPPDDWEVRFYTNENGFPGTELTNSPGKITPAAKADLGGQFFLISFVIDPPVPLDAGERYWVEWSGVGLTNEAGQATCRLWFRASDVEGNDFALTESDPIVDPESGGFIPDWSLEDNTETDVDFTFCIDTGIEIPPAPTGACCQCDGTCTDDAVQTDCTAITVLPNDGSDPFVTGDEIGQWLPNQQCGIDFVCEPRGSAGACPGGDLDPGESCELAQLVTDAELPLLVDNRCLASNPPTSYPDGVCDTPNPTANGPWTFEADAWFEWHVPNSPEFSQGAVVGFDTCGDTDYDSVIAVYASQACIGGDNAGLPCTTNADCPNGACDFTDACPPCTSCQGGDDEGAPCTSDGDCAGGGTCTGAISNDLLVGGQCIDGECRNAPDATIQAFTANQGACFLVRVGGFNLQNEQFFSDTFGRSLLEIEAAPSACRPSNAPLASTVIPDAGRGGAGRFISFVAGDEGLRQAVRVQFQSIPSPYTAWSLLEMWVGPGQWYCENSGAGVAPAQNSPPNFGCDSSGMATRAYRASTLQCDPFIRDWHGTCVDNVCTGGQRPGFACTTSADCVAPINVFHEGVIPSTGQPGQADNFTPTVYRVQVIEEACNFTNEADFSDFLDVVTSKWGDAVGTASPQATQGVVNVADVLTALTKFSNESGAITSMRIDMQAAAPPRKLIDHQVGIGEVTSILDAFAGQLYPPGSFQGIPGPVPCSAAGVSAGGGQ